MSHLLEDLCGEVHDSVDASKLLQDKEGDADLHSPHTQQLGCALLGHTCLATCTATTMSHRLKSTCNPRQWQASVLHCM